MEIQIVWGKGEGMTELSSFDLAMIDAGIGDFNLVPLTSMIPKGALIRKVGKYKNRKNREVGDVLNAVISQNISKGPGYLCAGLGWAQAEEGGIFLEIASEREEDVQRELERGLEEMMNARNWTWRDEIESRIVGTYSRNVGCALVVAVYDF